MNALNKVLIIVCVLFFALVLPLAAQDEDPAAEPWQVEEAAKFGTGALEDAEDVFPYTEFKLSPDGASIAVRAGDNIEIWNIADESLTTTIEDPLSSFAWSPDSSQIVTSLLETDIYIWDATTGEQLIHNEGYLLNSVRTRSIEWFNDTSIMTGSFGYELWDPTTEADPILVRCHPMGEKLLWSPDQRYVATMGSESTIIWICNTDFTPIRYVEGYRTVVWHPDVFRIATVGIYNTLRIWDLETGEVLSTASGGENNIRQIDWYEDSTRLVTGHTNGEIQLWERQTHDQLEMRLSTTIPNLSDVKWFGNQLITTSSAGLIQLWNIIIPEPVEENS